MEATLKGYIGKALTALGIHDIPVLLEHPADMRHGDWATSVAMSALAAKRKQSVKEGWGKRPRDVQGGSVGDTDGVEPEAEYSYDWQNPRQLAELIKTKILKQEHPQIDDIEIAGPGFINFKLSRTYFKKALTDALALGESFGNNATLKGKKVIVEYTDPNPFKEFHIGHLMPNVIGESISRIIEASGAETKRACYQGDVGLHVAKAIYGKVHNPELSWAQAYAAGSRAGEEAKAEILELNKKIYARSDEAINTLYDEGRKDSLEYFETIYKRLGTKFDYYFFESDTGEFGKKVVEEHPAIFEKSDGAIVYKGDESKGLHTRVFVNKEGLPTYEAKELGLAKIKHDTHPYDVSIIITGNEVNDYFKVLLDAMAKVFPELAAKTEHYSHGMLRLPTGKMSSRTGDVITADALIGDTKEKALQKITESTFSELEKNVLSEQVAIGAIKYSILRQAAGKDIIFDFEQSLSFEGDSGPYLQYTHARTRSLLAKAEGKPVDASRMEGGAAGTLHKFLLRFPEVVHRAQVEREPHYIATYLIEVAREFNSFYGNTIVLDGGADEPYKLALVQVTSCILKHGLWLLGIPAPVKM